MKRYNKAKDIYLDPTSDKRFNGWDSEQLYTKKEDRLSWKKCVT